RRERAVRLSREELFERRLTVERPRARDEHVLELGRRRPHHARQLAMVESAKLARDDERPRPRLPRDERELALAIDGEDRVRDRAETIERERERRALGPAR